MTTAAITGAQADTAGKVQAIVNAYQVVLDNANAPNVAAAGAVVNATQAQYAALGVTGVDTTQEVSLLGSVIDSKALADVETVAKLQSLATAVQAVMNGNATEAQLEALGVDPALVTASNLSTVQAALAAANDLTELNTLAGLQSVVQAAVTAAGKVAAYEQRRKSPAAR